MRFIDAIVDLIFKYVLPIYLAIYIATTEYSTESCIIRKLMPYSCAQIGVCMFTRL